MSTQKADAAAQQAVETFLNGKYKSKAEMEDAYAQLEKKLGEQGNELGTLRKQYDDYAKQLTQYQTWAQQVTPLVQWYQANQADLQQWAQAKANGQKVSKEMTNAVNSLLTKEEQEALIEQASRRSFEQAQAYLNTQLQQVIAAKTEEFHRVLSDREQAQARLYWSMLEKGLPKDRVEHLKQMNQETLRFADPNKHDPMKAAEEMLTLRDQMEDMKKQLEESKKQIEESRKHAVPSLGNRSIFKKPEPTNTAPADRDSRFKAVISELNNQYGADGLAALQNG